ELVQIVTVCLNPVSRDAVDVVRGRRTPVSRCRHPAIELDLAVLDGVAERRVGAIYRLHQRPVRRVGWDADQGITLILIHREWRRTPRRRFRSPERLRPLFGTGARRREKLIVVDLIKPSHEPAVFVFGLEELDEAVLTGLRLFWLARIVG